MEDIMMGTSPNDSNRNENISYVDDKHIIGDIFIVYGSIRKLCNIWVIWWMVVDLVEGILKKLPKIEKCTKTCIFLC